MKCYFHSHLSISVPFLWGFTGRLFLRPPLNFQVISSPMSKLPPSQILCYSFPICACVALLNPHGTLSSRIFFFTLFLIFLVLLYYQHDCLADFYWIVCNIFKFSILLWSPIVFCICSFSWLHHCLPWWGHSSLFSQDHVLGIRLLLGVCSGEWHWF